MISFDDVLDDLETAAEEQQREWRDPEADVEVDDVALATRVDELEVFTDDD